MSSTTVVETVERLAATDVASVDRAGLESTVSDIGTVRSWLDAIEVGCSRRSRELAAEGRSGAPESTLTDRGRRSGRDAAAAADREAVCSEMSGFEDALAAGEVSAGHVDAVARATKRLDEDVAAEFAEHEDELIAAAATERVEAFERRARDLATRLAAKRARSDADELDRQRARSSVKRWTDKSTGMKHTHLELDPLRDSALWGALDRQIAAARQDDANKAKPWPQLQVETIVDTVITGAGIRAGDEDVDTTGSEGAEPHSRSEPVSVDPSFRVPEATLLIDLGTLTDGLHEQSICELEDGTPIPVDTVRRLPCECEVLPIVLNGHGEALDAGRSTRTATRPQRRALRAMHRTCAHPDCTVTFSACRIHHVRWWWRNLGPTNLDNLIPLCEPHNHLVHEGRWTLTMTPDRIATWTRPDGTIAHHGTTIDRAPHGVGSHPPEPDTVQSPTTEPPADDDPATAQHRTDHPRRRSRQPDPNAGIDDTNGP